jgi:cyclopropane-fatty-acyl-phospholipid synthase
VVQRLLHRLEVGGLTVIENGERQTFGGAGSELQAVINVHSDEVYQRVLTAGIIGSGESYMQGHWSSPDLVSVIRLFSANLAAMQAMNARSSLLQRVLFKTFHLFNANSVSGSKRNISAHYDLGNDFFGLFLDSNMMYSSAVYPSAESSLDQASDYKLELLCRQLELTEDDHLLEIGTGWGGMAIYAASNYGCRVTTTTISREQYEHARERVAALGLSDRITVLCEDYRKLSGTYDKLVSIEMVEAVGHQFYAEYFGRCSRLLKPGGKFAMQAITISDQRYALARDSVDFIKRYIFPGGCLPSLAVISDHIARDTDMQIVDLRDITADYARTLAAWRERFLAQRETVRAQGFDETFLRMWEFYLAYCEGGFRERIISTVQITFAKPGYRFAG